MSIWEILLIGVDFIMCAGLVATVLLQSGHSAGLSGAIAGAGENVFGKKRGLDEILSRFTTGFSVLFLLVSLILGIMMK
ncbi:MAG: preprotein translocase subunit SecG [Thermaerobacter sp.]|jgi:preprotein translocase subunit SecG|nr:preprotein translocase subunit SecG [Thermaerobacter sp.]MDA8146978.1 preprotein translocase subunit SecG [Thermaerobacter sp.]